MDKHPQSFEGRKRDPETFDIQRGDMLRWTETKVKAQESRCYYDAYSVALGDMLYCFGEGLWKHGPNHMDVYVFNTVSLLWRKLTPAVTPGRGQRPLEVPSWRCDHTAVLVGDIVYIWGGWTNTGYCNVLYAFDVDAHTWSKPRVSGTVPERRSCHSACVLEKVMFIHGGSNTGHTNDIYKLDSTTMVWSLINTRGTPPPATSGPSATIIGTKMFVFGGSGGQYHNTIRVFDTETNHWMDTPSTQPLPEGRYGHSAFTYNGELYIFGGYGSRHFNDLWKYNPKTFSWKEVKPKGNGPLRVTDGCCCIVGDRIILFGGSSDGLFILDLSPSLKTLCKLAVIQYNLDQSELPHDIRWELAAMTKYKLRYDD